MIPWTDCPPRFLADLEGELRERFGIHHTTVQLEPAESPAPCRQAADGAV